MGACKSRPVARSLDPPQEAREIAALALQDRQEQDQQPPPEQQSLRLAALEAENDNLLESNEGESPPDLQDAHEPSVSALKLAALEAENADLREETEDLRHQLDGLLAEARVQIRGEDNQLPRTTTMENNIIGLEFPDGRVRYLHRDTAVNAGGFFAGWFGPNNIGEGNARTDEHGRKVYFLDRDGELFDKHIHPFLRSMDHAGELRPFAAAPERWRLLRKEAKFYALDGLVEMLNITHSCPYSPGDDRGVLYWLGTDKGKREYRNPQATGAVAVFVGAIGDLTLPKRRELFANDEYDWICSEAFTQESRQALVQHRPPILGYDAEGNTYNLNAREKCYSLWCNLSCYRIPTVVDLRVIKLRLTAYSLRFDGHGMTDRNLEASEDGVEWTVLHEARNDWHVARMRSALKHLWEKEWEACTVRETKVKISHEFVERERRHTWQIDPLSPTFFRYFRIIGSGSDYEREKSASKCLHGVGLELYGDVDED